MARTHGKLTAMAVNKVKDRGLYPDGGNLYLQVSSTGTKSWIFRYMINGSAKVMGLGAVSDVPLATQRMGDKEIIGAREKAAECRRLLKSGVDPLQARKREQERRRVDAARGITFKECAEAYIESHKAGWKNDKHIWQWENSLQRLVYPHIGAIPVQEIDIPLVMKVLQPIWEAKTETASRVRGRIESILDWATVREFRQGDNPARWRGRLESLLPSPTKIQKVKHHPALPYSEVADFMRVLHNQEGLSALALELTILTATRTSETLNAKWDEFDLKSKIWTIPAERMKMGKAHRIPLSPPALKIFESLRKLRTTDYVFAGTKGKPLSNMAMLVLLRRMNRNDITVHGFRSTFRDWCAEQTNYSREVAEAALAHSIGNSVEAAYRRGDLLEKRSQLMSEWARYCYLPQAKGKVLRIRG